MENFGLTELNYNEIRTVNGGGFKALAVWWIVDTISNWDAYSAAFMDGFNEVRKK